MKALTDELLNKYIDNDLSITEVNQLKEFLSSELHKFKAHKLVDEVLRKMEFDTAPAGITERIMQRINVAASVKPRMSNFMRVVFFLFGVSIFGSVIILLSQTSSVSSSEGLLPKEVIEYLNKFSFSLPSLQSVISSETTMIVISSLVLIVLISVYIFYNSHKSFKRKIEKFSH